MDWIRVFQDRVKYWAVLTATMKLLFPKIVREDRWFYWAAEEILASQEGLCSMDLVYLSVNLLYSNLLWCLIRLWVSSTPLFNFTGDSFSGDNGALSEDGRWPQSNIQVMDERKQCRRQGDGKPVKFTRTLPPLRGPGALTTSHMFLSFSVISLFFVFWTVHFQ